MTTAIEARRRQTGVMLDPSIDDNQLHIDLQRFLLDVVGSKKYDINVANSITGGTITRTMDGASTIQVDINDHGRKIIRSGIIGDGGEDHYPGLQVDFDGWWGHLAEIDKSADTLGLTFEDRIIYYLRQHKKPLKVSRRQMTRAEFIHSMVREVKAVRINFYSPAEHIVNPTEKLDTKTERRKKKKAGGFSHPAKLTVKGTKASKKQRDVGERILQIGSDMGASTKLLTTAIATSIDESSLNPNIGQDYMHSGHIGAFQQDSSAGSAWRKLGGGTGNLDADAKAFFKAGMPVDKKFPKVSIAVLADYIQYPGHQPGQPFAGSSPNFTVYSKAVAQFVDEAKVWVKEYQGGGGGSQTTTRRGQYYFHRGAPDGPHGENSWDCSGRLADEVNWHRFVVGNTFFYVRDFDLMKQKPIAHLSELDDAIESIDFNIDTNKPINEATITCRAVRWMAHPGEIIVIEDSGPANDKWLVQEISKDIFDPNCTVTVRQPHGSKKEPAPPSVTVSHTQRTSGKAYTGATGTAVLAAGADRPGVPTKRHVIRFVELMAGALGKTIYMTTGSQHSRLTTSGNVSDHWSGNAVDLGSVANHFAIGGRGGDAIARAAAEVLGLTLKDVTGNWNWHGWTYRGTVYRVQVGWKVPGHYDHVHIGVEKTQGRAQGQNYGPAGGNVPGH